MPPRPTTWRRRCGSAWRARPGSTRRAPRPPACRWRASPPGCSPSRGTAWSTTCATRPQASLDAPAGDDAGQTLADTLAAPSGFGPVRRIETRQQAAQLLAALDALPPEQREAFLLQAEADMSVADIASTTGVPFETARSRLRYARAALRRTLETMA